MRPKAANAASISRLVLALRTWICSPMARAATSTSLTVVSAFLGLAGLTSTATRAALGTSSRRSSSRFACNSPPRKLIPVRLPPGWARLVTRPSLTGSSLTAKTTGIVVGWPVLNVCDDRAGMGDGDGCGARAHGVSADLHQRERHIPPRHWRCWSELARRCRGVGSATLQYFTFGTSARNQAPPNLGKGNGPTRS